MSRLVPVIIQACITTAERGSAQHMEWLVSEIDAARDACVSGGVEVSELYYRDGRLVGLHPQTSPNLTSASFSDPDASGRSSSLALRNERTDSMVSRPQHAETRTHQWFTWVLTDR
jgi:hypothetical protein